MTHPDSQHRVDQELVSLVQQAKDKHFPNKESQPERVGFIRTMCADGVLRYLPMLTLPDGNQLIVGMQLFEKPLKI